MAAILLNIHRRILKYIKVVVTTRKCLLHKKMFLVMCLEHFCVLFSFFSFHFFQVLGTQNKNIMMYGAVVLVYGVVVSG